MDDETYLRNSKWTIDRGMWIYNGDTSVGYPMDQALSLQRAHDAAEARAPWWVGSLRAVPSIH